jgi:hypothetical protein
MILTESDRLKERIKFKTEFVKILVLISVTTLSGSLSLILEGLDTVAEYVMAVCGMCLTVSFTAILLIQYVQTIKLIKYGNHK